ncbi:Cytochrome c family profile [Acididesulfobacillus acetoxydans]|uniref:Cytochrome b6 n=1 Tax=Acididesulfobacillus acetoxydans TaxID=1561005 RepID=A0A8S0X3G3_9FIRM|nr:cytochrome b N-terminal domain-containing protein [Acididesulfobacillus acetoxydans]CAA7600070.1 Cytochrome c family profile [Acididesulfobacillus acetoxydans]CEJ07845.1 Cytochrome b6 [Acididesulfobacillus acetoxydans]
MINWLDERLHVRELTASLFEHPVSKRSNVLDYLGFATFYVFCSQAVTGILLATVYRPTASGAYDSIKQLQGEPVGAFVRSLHSWGANFMVVLLVLHLLRVFYEGAYKKPRELTWLLGSVLLIATLGLAFTGYLLPWDQEGYWATTVGTAMPSHIPWIGDYLVRLLRDGTQVTGATLTRFYSVHMLILPALLLLAFLPHFFFVLRQGMASGDELAKAQKRGKCVDGDSLPFWPDVAVRMILFVLLIGAALWLLAALYPKSLGAPADPLNKSQYVPEPAWYFFGVYQLLKYFPGKLDVLAMVVLPFAGGILLFALPWLDRNPARSVRKRPLALSLAGVLVAGMVFLTYQGMNSVPKALASAGVVVHPGFKENVEPIFQSKCITCHGTSGGYGLDNYTAVMKKNVVPGNPDQSKLIRKLEGSDKPQMPIGQPPLTSDQIQTIRNWIKDGAKNN